MTTTSAAALTAGGQLITEPAAVVVAALETAWVAIRTHHVEVPPAVLIIASGTDRGQLSKWGHFAAGRWQHGQHRLPEVLVSGEGLGRQPAEVLATLLHEAAHALASVRDIKDTSRQGRWHNKRFAALATEVGLSVEQRPKHGWAATSCAPLTFTRYQDTLASLKAALTLWRYVEPATPTSPRRLSDVACTCDCNRKIRVSVTTLTAGSILCALCDGPFQPEEPLDGGDPQ